MFGDILKELRQQKELSQEEFASRTGLHRTYVSQLERNLKSPSLNTLQKIGDALGMSASDLVKKMESRK